MIDCTHKSWLFTSTVIRTAEPGVAVVALRAKCGACGAVLVPESGAGDEFRVLGWIREPAQVPAAATQPLLNLTASSPGVQP